MDKLKSNLIDFSKFMPNEQESIDREAAKKYFISQVLPYVCESSLQRLITANASGDPQLVRLEMTRIFIEAELTKPTITEPNGLQLFFSGS